MMMMMINNGMHQIGLNYIAVSDKVVPCQGYCFFLEVEILSIAIRASRDIKRIQIANWEIKLSQYADDTTVFCRDIFSLGKLLDLVSTFGDFSGLKLNVAKSEAMWLGKSANRKDMPFDIKEAVSPNFVLLKNPINVSVLIGNQLVVA